MKYLILLLLTMSCTDKKVTTEPVVVEPIIAEVIEPEPIIEEAPEPEILFTNTIVNSDEDTTDPSYTPPEITKLSYDKGLDLMLVNTYFQSWLGEVLDTQQNGRVVGYHAMYWDTNTQTYYGVTNNYDWYHGAPITNMQFEYVSNNKKKQQEDVFYPTMKEIFTNTGAPFLYIGSISPLERVYLDPTNQEYYIKYLAPWDTSIYTVDVTEDTCTTNTNTLPIFPFYKPSIYTDYREASESYIISTNDKEPFIYYTNSDGDKFSDRGPLDAMRKVN